MMKTEDNCEDKLGKHTKITIPPWQIRFYKEKMFVRLSKLYHHGGIKNYPSILFQPQDVPALIEILSMLETARKCMKNTVTELRKQEKELKKQQK